MLSNLPFGSSNQSSQATSSAPIASPNTPHSAIFSSIDDELRDARCIYSQGQEEDLRYALERIIKRVEELASLLKVTFKAQSELETQLDLAKSNLQLVLSNNEMLEEALRRETPCNARDVGWRRWSAREVQNMQRPQDDRLKNLDYGPLNESGRPSVPPSATPPTVNDSHQGGIRTQQPQTPITSQESRFFKFRLGGGPKPSAIPSHASHLTSPSLPSLISDTREREFEDLQAKYEQERQAHQTLATEKAALEAELESLSQALFEEANKMVATERIRRAETEEELLEVRREKDVLREALRVVEGENGLLRSASLSSGAPLYRSERPPSNVTPPVLHSNPSITIAVSAASPGWQSDEPAPDVALYKAPCADPASDLPDHLKSFILEPAPKLPVVTYRETQSMENRTGCSTPTDNLHTSLFPMTLSDSSSLAVIADGPSPWVDT